MMSPTNTYGRRPSDTHGPWWRSWRLVPAIYAALALVVLVAELASGNGLRGLIGAALLAGVAAVYAFGGRFQIVRQARGDMADEREASIHTRSMAGAGVALVVALTGCIVVQLARGENPSPFTELMMLGGGAYILGLFIHR